MTTIQLNADGSHRLRQFKVRSRCRRLSRANWMDIISNLLVNIDDETWWKTIDQFTPESYYLQEALRNPEIKKKLIGVVMSDDFLKIPDPKIPPTKPSVVLRKFGESL
ncbi:MAG: hypothetical protein KDD35_00125 [Bdellovibrionales bacterium]|nr:hypothetical protein [Bdellovibrionales bacterium]